MSFPDGFLWGAATAAHQVEGNNSNSDWWLWELETAQRKAQAARAKQWPDFIGSRYPFPFQEENYISAKACDHYHRFEADFDLAKSLGHKALRFSIEWARIEPEEGKFDQSEIEHYRQVIKALRQRGLEPFVTLWHFTLPAWFAKKGGWLQKGACEYFVRYVQKVVEALKDQVVFWMTINEPIVYVSASFLRSSWPPQEKSLLKAWRVVRNLIKAHKLSYQAMHQISPSCQVGIAKNITFFGGSFLASFYSYFPNKYFLQKIKGFQDFIGLNYYRFVQLAFAKRKLWRTDLDWDIWPEGIYHILKYLKKYHLPIYITENGLADAQDRKRKRYILEHLRFIWQAIQEGTDVKGYFYWSLLDNFEWAEGFWPRFGLVEVDYQSQARKIRSSAQAFAEICKTNKLIL